ESLEIWQHGRNRIQTRTFSACAFAGQQELQERANRINIGSHVINGVRFEQLRGGEPAAGINGRILNGSARLARAVKGDQSDATLVIEDNAVGFKSVIDPTVPMELLRQVAKLQANFTRFFLIDLIEVSDGLTSNLLEHDVDIVAVDRLLDGFEQSK